MLGGFFYAKILTRSYVNKKSALKKLSEPWTGSYVTSQYLTRETSGTSATEHATVQSASLKSSTLAGLEEILECCLHSLPKGSLPFHCQCIASLMLTFLVKLIKLRSEFPEWNTAPCRRIISGSILKHSSDMQENSIWKQTLVWHGLSYWSLQKRYLNPKVKERSSSYLKILIFPTS